jgi:hypothetical protein
MSRNHTTAWDEMLDQLDRTTRHAEKLLRERSGGPFPSFDVTRPATALPRHLLPRAQELLHRQLRLQIHLARGVEDCQRQLSYVDHVAEAARVIGSRASGARPAYLDKIA